MGGGSEQPLPSDRGTTPVFTLTAARTGIRPASPPRCARRRTPSPCRCRCPNCGDAVDVVAHVAAARYRARGPVHRAAARLDHLAAHTRHSHRVRADAVDEQLERIVVHQPKEGQASAFHHLLISQTRPAGSSSPMPQRRTRTYRTRCRSSP